MSRLPCALLLAVLATSGAAAESVLFREQSVMEDLRIGARQARVVALHSALPSRPAGARLADLWRAEHRGPVIVAERDGWVVVSRRVERHMHTVQLRDAAGGSTGYRTEWAIDDARPARTGAAVELDQWLAGLPVIGRFESSDAGRRGETALAVVPRDADAAVALLSARIEQSGYRNDAAMSRPRANPAVLIFRKGPRDVVLSAEPRQSRTMIAIHHLSESPQ